MNVFLKSIRSQELYFSRVLVAAYVALACVPVAYCALGSDWILLAYVPLLVGLLCSRGWERNSYAVTTAWLAVAFSIAAPLVCGKWIFVAWLFNIVAFISTVTIPIEMRMPLVVYYVCYYLLLPSLGLGLWVLVCISALFLLAMWPFEGIWRCNNWQTANKLDAVPRGPAEPPFSASLAIAILLAVFLPLCARVLDGAYDSSVFAVVKDCGAAPNFRG